MDSVDLEVMRAAVSWVEAGHGATIGTVTRTWGSAPRPVGAMLVIRDDGHVIGIGLRRLRRGRPDREGQGPQAGGRQARGHHLRHHQRGGHPVGPAVRRHPPARPGAGHPGLEAEGAARDHRAPRAGRPVPRHGLGRRAGYEAGKWSDALEFDGKVLKTVHGPRWRLLIIGAGQTSRYLAQMAMALDYHVTVCDPREEYAEEWNLAGATLVRGYPDDTVVQMNPDAHLAVVAVTHDPKLDDAALLEGAQVALLLCRRARLAEEQRRAAQAPRRLRSLGRRDRAAARAGRPEDRRQDAARNRRRHPRRDDCGPPRRGGAGARAAGRPERRPRVRGHRALTARGP